MLESYKHFMLVGLSQIWLSKSNCWTNFNLVYCRHSSNKQLPIQQRYVFFQSYHILFFHAFTTYRDFEIMLKHDWKQYHRQQLSLVTKKTIVKAIKSSGINSLRWFITLLDRYKAGDEKDKQMGRTRDKLIVLYCHWQYLSSTKYTFPHILSTAFVYFSCFLIKLIKIKNYYVSIACIKVKRKHSRFTSLASCTVAVHFCIRIRIKRHNFLIEFMCESIQKVRVMCIAMR